MVIVGHDHRHNPNLGRVWKTHCVECFMSCYLNKLFCIFGIYFSKYYRPLGSWSAQKYLVWLCWKGCRPPSTHWRGPTTDPHGDSWLLALAPGPVRPSSSNLNPPDSSVGPMLMRALVRTPDQHDPMTNRVPSLKPSLTRASW